MSWKRKSARRLDNGRLFGRQISTADPKAEQDEPPDDPMESPKLDEPDIADVAQAVDGEARNDDSPPEADTIPDPAPPSPSSSPPLSPPSPPPKELTIEEKELAMPRDGLKWQQDEQRKIVEAGTLGQILGAFLEQTPG